MVVHLPTRGERLSGYIGVGVQLGEKFMNRCHLGGKHERLVTVVAGTEISFPEGLGHRNLSHLFSIAEYAKFGLAPHDLFSTNHTRLSALEGQTVIINDLLKSKRKVPEVYLAIVVVFVSPFLADSLFCQP